MREVLKMNRVKIIVLVILCATFFTLLGSYVCGKLQTRYEFDVSNNVSDNIETECISDDIRTYRAYIDKITLIDDDGNTVFMCDTDSEVVVERHDHEMVVHIPSIDCKCYGK